MGDRRGLRAVGEHLDRYAEPGLDALDFTNEAGNPSSPRASGSTTSGRLSRRAGSPAGSRSTSPSTATATCSSSRQPQASYLLQRTGYGVGRYVSIEQLIFEAKDDYHETLALSTEGWLDDGNHDLWPWARYLLERLDEA